MNLILETERLLLRPLTLADAEDMFTMTAIRTFTNICGKNPVSVLKNPLQPSNMFCNNTKRIK